MYKNILVITDNLDLCRRVDGLFNAAHFSGIHWSFAVSPTTNIDIFRQLVSRDFIAVDMKDETTVDRLIRDYDLLISIHCKQLFPARLVHAVKCINVHPGYNPLNRGWYPQVFAIIHGWGIGATIHEITTELDHGPIIDREFVEKRIEDTSETLYNRILDKEIELLSRNLEAIVSGNYSTTPPENEGHLFLKKDFNALREIDLTETVKAGDLIRRLQALTHGDYRNAWFNDPKTGKKYFVEIRITPEQQ